MDDRAPDWRLMRKWLQEAAERSPLSALLFLSSKNKTIVEVGSAFDLTEDPTQSQEDENAALVRSGALDSAISMLREIKVFASTHTYTREKIDSVQ